MITTTRNNPKLSFNAAQAPEVSSTAAGAARDQEMIYSYLHSIIDLELSISANPALVAPAICRCPLMVERAGMFELCTEGLFLRRARRPPGHRHRGRRPRCRPVDCALWPPRLLGRHSAIRAAPRSGRAVNKRLPAALGRRRADACRGLNFLTVSDGCMIPGGRCSLRRGRRGRLLAGGTDEATAVTTAEGLLLIALSART
jgi:hypothetical protein